MFCKETKPRNINLLVFLGGMGSFMIICLHKWANMHIGDFKDMIALVASKSNFILNISNPICGLYFIVCPNLLCVLYASTCVGEESLLNRSCSG